AAVVVVDLLRGLLEGIRPVVETTLDDAPVDLVELVLRHDEGVVLRRDVAVDVVEVHRDAVAELDHEERPEACGLGQPEHLREKRRRLLLVAAPHDRVIELRGHRGTSVVSVPPTIGPEGTPWNLELTSR